MKLSTSLDTAKNALHTADDAAAAKVLKELGFDGVDFSFCGYDAGTFLSDETREKLLGQAAAIRAAGLDFCQCHLPYLPGDRVIPGGYQGFEDCFLPMYIRCLEICGEIGCHIAVIHLYFEDDAEATFRGNVAMITKMMPYLEKYGITLAIENIYGGGDAYLDCHISCAADIMRYVEHFNSPLVGVCLDTGHAVCCRQDTLEMARTFGKSLTALHINASSGRDSHLIPGSLLKWIDYNDYEELSAVLKGNGYKGAYNLEITAGRYPAEANVGLPFLQIAAGVGRYYAGLAE